MCGSVSLEVWLLCGSLFHKTKG